MGVIYGLLEAQSRMMTPQDLSLLAGALPSPWAPPPGAAAASAGAAAAAALQTEPRRGLLLPLPDALALLLLRALPPLAPPTGGGAAALDAAALSAAPRALRGCEEDTREASLAAAELLARLAPPPPGGFGSGGGAGAGAGAGAGPAALLAAAAGRLMAAAPRGGGDRRADGAAEGMAAEGLVNFCLTALLAPAVLGCKASDTEVRGRLATLAAELLRAVPPRSPAAAAALADQLQRFLAAALPPPPGGAGGGGAGGGGLLAEAAAGRGAALLAAGAVVQGLSQLLALPPPPPGAPPPLPPQLRSDLAERCLGLAAALPPGGGGPQQQAAADDALQLALQLGLPPTRLLSAMLQPTTAAAPGAPAAAAPGGAARGVMAGQGALRMTLTRWLVFNAGDVAGGLLEAVSRGVTGGDARAAAAGRAALDLFCSACASLGRPKAAAPPAATPAGAPPSPGGGGGGGFGGGADFRAAGFVGAALRALGAGAMEPVLAAARGTGPAAGDARAALLRLLEALLPLDAAAALAPSLSPGAFSAPGGGGGGRTFCAAAYCELLTSGRGTGGMAQTRALELLGAVASAMSPAALAACGVAAALGEVVAGWGSDAGLDRRVLYKKG
ncbi:MAG: hypothetical protein J3K34DRAFT_464369 [Monoraphidium minutum]|nr:MAG: hypothetical protein J3K34DRAFT_464369 [Monoraphidium minutum]